MKTTSKVLMRSAATIILLLGVAFAADAQEVATALYDWQAYNNKANGNWFDGNHWSSTGDTSTGWFWDRLPDLGTGYPNATVTLNGADGPLGLYITGSTNYTVLSDGVPQHSLNLWSVPATYSTTPPPYGLTNYDPSGVYGVTFISVSGSGTNTFGTPISVTNSSSWPATGFVIDQNSSHLFTISGAINGGGVPMTVQGNGNTTISGAISSSSTLVKTGAGTLTLSGANTYSGGTMISNGTVQLSGNGTLGNGTGNLNITNGATLDLGGTTQSVFGIGAPVGAGYGVVGNIQNGTLNIETKGLYFQSGTLSADLTSTANSNARLYIGGDPNATVLLGGTNTVQHSDNISLIIGKDQYTGAAGTVKLISAAAMGFNTQRATLWAGTVDLNGQTNVTIGTIRLAGGATSFLINGNTSTPASFGNSVELTSSDSYSIGGAGNLTLSGSISLMSGISGAGITKSGSGTLSLAGSSSYDAGTTIQAGTLNINADAALGAVPASAATNITFSGNSTLQAGAAAVSLSSNRNVAISNGVTATFDTQGNTMTIPGSISGSGSLTKTGSGTMVLSGTNTYSGGTTLSTGTLVINSATALGTGTFTINGGAIDSTAGSMLTLSNNNPQNWNGSFSFLGTQALNLGTGPVTLLGNATLTLRNGLIVGGGIGDGGNGHSLTLQSLGSGLALNGTGTYSGGTTLNDGTVVLGAKAALGSGNVILNGGSLGETAANALTGGQSLILQGATADLDQPNNYSGGTTVYQGILHINNAGALGSGTLTISGGPTIDNTSGSEITLTTNNPQVWNGLVNFGGTNSLNLGTGTVTLAGDFQINTGASTLTEPGTITGPYSLTKRGSGTLVLSGSNTYTGTTTINGGTLNINADAALGAVPASAATNITFSGNSTLQAGAAVVSLNANRNIAVNSGVTATFDTQGNAMSVAGVVGGSGGLTKIGSGTLTLSGVNTYTGLTTVNSGTLAVTGSLSGGGDIAAESGGTLVVSGNGSLSASHEYIDGTGVMTQNGGANTVSVEAFFGNGSTGTYNLNGGTNAINGTLVLGAWPGSNGSYVVNGSGNLSVRDNEFIGASGTGTFTQNGGSNTCNGTLFLGHNGGTGVYNMNGGVNSFNWVMNLGDNSGSTGTYNLNGGTLAAVWLSGGSGTGVFNFNGGLLQAASGSSSNFMSGLTAAYVQSGGANIDTNGQNITIGQSLLDGGGGGGLNKTGSGTLVLSGANTFSGTTTVNSGSLQVTGSLANNGSNMVFVAKDVDGVFGNGNGDASIVRRVAANAAYAGFGSAIASIGSGELPITADILAGNASSQADVSMAWRTRNTAEKTQAGGGLISEVLNLGGIALSGTGTHDGSYQTDTFVLQMNYDPGQLLSIWGLTETQAIAQNRLYLGYLDLGTDGLLGTADDHWTRAVDGNFGGTPSFVGNHPYDSSYFVLGDYGVDTTDHVVWAVLDHNSEFGVVPEPSSFVLFCIGAMSLLAYSWHRYTANRYR